MEPPLTPTPSFKALSANAHSPNSFKVILDDLAGGAPIDDDRGRADDRGRETDSDGAVVSYSFNNALFQDAVLFFASGVITRGLFAYICFVVLATLLAALCACSPDGASSHLLGAAGCWRNAYAAGWADVTLNTLTAFLLGLLVNNVLNRWWTTRVMVQDAINSCAQVLFLLTASLKPRAGREAPELELRDGTLRAIARRLKLAFRILLLSAKTDYSKDRIGVRGAKARRTFVAKEVEDYYDALSRPKPDEPPRSVGRAALLTLEERATLGNKRHAYVVLAWIARDAMALVEGKHVGEARFGDVLAALSKLRALCEDVPMFTRVQLPFVTVALVVRGARCAARSHAHTHTRAHSHAHAHTHTRTRTHTRLCAGGGGAPHHFSAHVLLRLLHRGGPRGKGVRAQGVCGPVFHHRAPHGVPQHLVRAPGAPPA